MVTSNENPYILSPANPLRVYWDIFFALSITYLCWIIPFVVSISWWEVPTSIQNFNYFLHFCSLIDIILNFHTGIISYRYVIMDRKIIAKHYLSTWFIIDLFASLPIELLFYFF